MKKSRSYHWNVILILLLSIVAFYGFKKVLPERLFPEQEIDTENMIIDNLLLQAIAEDTLSVADSTELVEKKGPKSELKPAGTKIPDDRTTTNPAISSKGYVNLSRFYTKLQQLETDRKKKVRIAYFGDSMNDGDLIVQDIRQEFQSAYGGQGVGYVSMTSLSAGARYSVSHQFSKNWRTQSFITVKKPMSPFGVDGQVFFGNDSTKTYWTKYKAQGLKNATQLYRPSLFYGKSDNKLGTLTIEKEGEENDIRTLTPTQVLNTMSISDVNIKSFKANFNKIDSIPIYGFNFDDGQGVHIDNFSLRGNSGLPLSTLNVELMNAFDEVLEYDLIILQYGANVLSHEVESYGWYDRGMRKVIENLQSCFPYADILVISAADKATMIDEVMQTDPAAELLVKTQRNYASKTNSGFINLFNLMGGNGSMVEWVDDNLAGKDYTHFNAQGSKKIAKLIYEEINKGYKLFKSNDKSRTGAAKVDTTIEVESLEVETVVK